MAKVAWLPEALQDVARWHEFLVEKSPDAARKAAERIVHVARQLEQHPEMGQPMEDGVRRQVSLHFGPGAYVIRYRFDRAGSVAIVRVWHSHEQRET